MLCCNLYSGSLFEFYLQFDMRKCIGLVTAILGLVFASCEKTISFKPNDSAPVVVIEATIENDKPPVVILSHSLNYFNEITPDLLASSFVRNAEVTVSNGAKTQ